MSEQNKIEYSIKNIIKLNIGGKEFTTTRSTLNECSPNYFTEHLLENGSFASTHYFIDRDPTTFIYILNYLRGYSLSLLPESPLSNPYLQRQLLEEAEFYQLNDLKEGIEKHLQRHHPLPKKEESESESEEPEDETPIKNLALWHQLENVRKSFEKTKQVRPEGRQNYPQGFNPYLRPDQNPTPTAIEIKNQINILKKQQEEWKIEDKIEETKEFLLTSIQYLQILSPQNRITQNLKEQVEIFYQQNQPLFRQLATQTNQVAQAPFNLLNQLLNFIWSQGLEKTPEGENENKSPADVMLLLLSKLSEVETNIEKK